MRRIGKRVKQSKVKRRRFAPKPPTKANVKADLQSYVDGCGFDAQFTKSPTVSVLREAVQALASDDSFWSALKTREVAFRRVQAAERRAAKTKAAAKALRRK